MGVGWLMVVVGVVQFLSRIAGIRWLLRKNRIENGRRADSSGSKPHSYGDNFSLSGFVNVNW